jgi:hypothetical protein
MAAGEISVGPDGHAKLSRVGEHGVARLELCDVGAAREELHVELVRVGLVSGQEVTHAQGPVFLIELSHRAIGQPDLVGGIVEGAGGPDRPVHEIGARVHGVGVVVEDVMDGEFSDLDGEPRYVALLGHLAVRAFDRFLLAA